MAEFEQDLDQAFPQSESRRADNPGAEKWIGKKIDVLDHGFVYLVDYLGNDQAIEQAARVSYGGGTRSVSQIETLIRRLMRDRHTSPFEMAEMKFHASMPIFVARQWVRHRTASINEISARYSVLPNVYYVPALKHIASQSKTNRQGRGEILDEEDALNIQFEFMESAERQFELYHDLLNDDGNGKPVDENRPMLARELARAPLPLGTYTEWYWKIDLHNLLHFLHLRLADDAQLEIREYAKAMSTIVKDAFPITWKAFEDYQLNAMSLSAPEQSVIIDLLKQSGVVFDANEVAAAAERMGLKNKTEFGEFGKKLKKLGVIGE